jgi:hypothetical protein
MASECRAILARMFMKFATAVGQRESETVMPAADGCVFESLAIPIGWNPKVHLNQFADKRVRRR